MFDKNSQDSPRRLKPLRAISYRSIMETLLNFFPRFSARFLSANAFNDLTRELTSLKQLSFQIFLLIISLRTFFSFFFLTFIFLKFRNFSSKLATLLDTTTLYIVIKSAEKSFHVSITNDIIPSTSPKLFPYLTETISLHYRYASATNQLLDCLRLSIQRTLSRALSRFPKQITFDMTFSIRSARIELEIRRFVARNSRKSEIFTSFAYASFLAPIFRTLGGQLR